MKGIFQRLQHRSPLCLGTLAVPIFGYLMYKAVRFSYLVCRRVSAQVVFNRLEPDVVHLFIHHRWSHGPNYFLHCFKVETFLRLAQIPYVAHFTSDPSISPTGRLPFIIHNRITLGDSATIVQYLTAEFNIEMDCNLSLEERAVGRATVRMVETSLNYALQRTLLWERPDFMVDMFQKEFALEQGSAKKMVKGIGRTLMDVLKALGYGNLPRGQYKRQFLEEVKGLESLIGGRPFLLGDKPTSYDSSVYAWLQVAREMGRHGRALSYVVDSKAFHRYVERMTNLAFPDFWTMGTSSEDHKFTPHICGRRDMY
ncbi:hypothetical protein TRVL_05611 [Trypanosoma vivax]|uniref:Thioredoxin-like fold domain-containing protein n=1 Tax=Trypanosoma vivax (strain Y486) TaxID=1055687 RepID=G0U1Q7_TRYVY|nr:hypothetical protein TRVL_05611 [Trypanosoma vivax]CCC50014.1 conserved hypothetical protein [Trypanosoma vivax Y486]